MRVLEKPDELLAEQDDLGDQSDDGVDQACNLRNQVGDRTHQSLLSRLQFEASRHPLLPKKFLASPYTVATSRRTMAPSPNTR